MGDEEEERVRRIFQLFYGLRGVDRRFYLSVSPHAGNDFRKETDEKYRLHFSAHYTYPLTMLVSSGATPRHQYPKSHFHLKMVRSEDQS
jgi:hypothetical protein